MKAFFSCGRFAGVTLLLLVAGCSRPARLHEMTPKDAEIIERCQRIYYEAKNTPAEFRADMVASRDYSIARRVLWGKRPPIDAQEIEGIRKQLTAFLAEVDQGLNWPIKQPEEFSIPKADAAPVIDGRPEEPAWKQARTFEGCFLFGNLQPATLGAEWKVMWDEQCLYVAGSFPDTSIQSVKNGVYIHEGDAVEIFVLPDRQLRAYWEVGINPRGDVFSAYTLNNRWGGFNTYDQEQMPGLRAAARIHEGGYTVEVAIPFATLPNYRLGNKPRVGESLYFNLVRVNAGPGGAARMYSVRPLLYEAHNIFGYPKGILAGPAKR